MAADPVVQDLNRHLDELDKLDLVDEARRRYVEERWQRGHLIELVLADLSIGEEAVLNALLKTDPAAFGHRVQQIARRNLEREAEQQYPYNLIFLRKQAD